MAELAGEVPPHGLRVPPVDEELARILEGQELSLNFVVSCARTKDCPIVYASDGFYELTGYSAAETIGRNCRFLQGARTQHNKARPREADRSSSRAARLHAGTSGPGAGSRAAASGAPSWGGPGLRAHAERAPPPR